MNSIKWHFFWWFNYFVLTLLLKRKILGNNRKFELEKWGSVYGGWYIPTNLVRRNWIYYLVGVGDDITFDLALVRRVGCHVYLFDPTPESIKFMRKYKSIRKIHFYPTGVWDENASLSFNKPADSLWNTYSIVDLQGTKKPAFEAECKTLKTIMMELGHKRIDFLKLDIDGSEYRVLTDMLKSRISPKVLLVEFDQPVSVIKTFNMIQKIVKKGYVIAVRDMWNFTFIRKSFKK